MDIRWVTTNLTTLLLLRLGTWFINVLCLDSAACEYDITVEEAPMVKGPLSNYCAQNSALIPAGSTCISEGIEYTLDGTNDEKGPTTIFNFIYFPGDSCPYLFSLSLRLPLFHQSRVILSYAESPK